MLGVAHQQSVEFQHKARNIIFVTEILVRSIVLLKVSIYKAAST